MSVRELLEAWRRDLNAEPIPELVDVDTAVALVREAALAR